MVWGKVDDKLHSHPKAEAAGLAAMGLWGLALSYCCDHLTDGYVTPERAARIAGSAPVATKLALALCEAKLWHTADGPCHREDADCDAYRKPGGTPGWRFHEPRREMLAGHVYVKAHIPRRLRESVIERDGLVCGICKSSVERHELHIDHIIDEVVGGPTTLPNLRVTHGACNMSRPKRRRGEARA